MRCGIVMLLQVATEAGRGPVCQLLSVDSGHTLACAGSDGVQQQYSSGTGWPNSELQQYGQPPQEEEEPEV